ncbi:uncharacterized protein LOC129600742 [Paramacrobiotus metropolitanus]|uniref:uncharacterized protein LOC129600742 n=1 Tax=Paramacrobiotus metropolitanus TaxID=2943436 RepID=UPI0024463C95|nr:uncharacterized protein LOC129600742 [Paramacrobiotus metropolitanus]
MDVPKSKTALRKLQFKPLKDLCDHLNVPYTFDDDKKKLLQLLEAHLFTDNEPIARVVDLLKLDQTCLEEMESEGVTTRSILLTLGESSQFPDNLKFLTRIGVRCIVEKFIRAGLSSQKPSNTLSTGYKESRRSGSSSRSSSRQRGTGRGQSAKGHRQPGPVPVPERPFRTPTPGAFTTTFYPRAPTAPAFPPPAYPPIHYAVEPQHFPHQWGYPPHH